MTMRNWKNLLGMALMGVMALTFSACGDDGDDNNNGQGGNTVTNGVFQGAKRVMGSNLPKAFGRTDYERFTLTYDAQGFLTKVHRDRVGDDSSQKEWTVSYEGDKVTVAYYKNGSFKRNMTGTFGSNGFLSEYEEDGDKLRFTYDGDYLTALTVIEKDGDEETLSMTWQGGDIIQGGWDGKVTSISYVDRNQNVVDNVGGVMEYDGSMNLDMDDWNMMYYGGFIGKATAHLPQAYASQSSDYSTTGTNEWTLDSKGRAIKLVANESKVYYSSDYVDVSTKEFFWEW